MAKDIEQLINSTLTSREEHVGLEVSCLDLLDFDPSLAHSTLLFPLLALQIFDEVKLYMFELAFFWLNVHNVDRRLSFKLSHCMALRPTK
jgi:hypothetical protein